MSMIRLHIVPMSPTRSPKCSPTPAGVSPRNSTAISPSPETEIHQAGENNKRPRAITASGLSLSPDVILNSATRKNRNHTADRFSCLLYMLKKILYCLT